jgi:hypothetical protein
MTTQPIRDAMAWALEADIEVTDLQWFDISGASASTDAALQPFDTGWLRQYRPPFARCMVVHRSASQNHALYDVVMTVAGEDPEEGIVVSMYKGPHGALPRKLPLMVYLVDGHSIRYGSLDEDEELPREEAEMMLGMVSMWYSALGHSTKTSAERSGLGSSDPGDGGLPCYSPFVRPTFTNKRKIAAGKAPTYDWRTVYVRLAEKSGDNTSESAQPSTHASPRLHDRRGHIRRLQSGKNVWVRACKVGQAELGTVFHDYQIIGVDRQEQPPATGEQPTSRLP